MQVGDAGSENIEQLEELEPGRNGKPPGICWATWLRLPPSNARKRRSKRNSLR
jgi:hypothetical protein